MVKKARVRKLFVGAIAVFGLAACASPKYVVSDVTRHHTLSATPSGQTFAVVATEDDQDESLAFKAYADVVSDSLSHLGYRRFDGQSTTPSVVVTLKWSVEGPSPDVKSRNSGFGYGFGYGSRYSRFGYGFDGPYTGRTDTRQMYVRRVEVALYDGATYNTEDPRRIFEGSAVSAGTNGQIDPVMPYIVKAIFDQYPGESGSTKTIRVEVPPESEAVQTSQYSGKSSK